MMRYFFYPKNQDTNISIAQALNESGKFPNLTSLEYKGKRVENLYEIDLEFLQFWENSIRNGNNFFKVELYSLSDRFIVQKKKFPRVQKPVIKIQKKKIK